ncbi:MAG: hypothetical protein JST21_15005 [Bacteroidetes bacterium]|nr:hypothetical protein [Bacteroidota bacterium]
MQLQLLASHKIDEQKWDQCLKSGTNGLIYSTTDFLCTLCDNWDAIVVGDYDYIMPVPWRKKYGIKYCYHVPFLQQAGVFGKNVSEKIVAGCFDLLRKKFLYGDYAFNYKNIVGTGKICNNFTLSLASNYNSTSFFYSDKLKADLNKAQCHSFDFVQAGADEAINLYHQLYAPRFPHIGKDVFKKLFDFCLIKEKQNNLIVRKIKCDGSTLAINLLLKDQSRLYNIISCTTAEGRNQHAGHALHDSIIKEFSQTGWLLDFEGSDIPGVAHFYKSFGAMNQPYTRVHFNALPKILQLFKR